MQMAFNQLSVNVFAIIPIMVSTFAIFLSLYKIYDMDTSVWIM